MNEDSADRKTICDDEEKTMFFTQDQDAGSSSVKINSEELSIMSESEQKTNELEQIRLEFLRDVHEGKPIDMRKYWRKARKELQPECRLILDNAWFRYFSADIAPQVDVESFQAKAAELGINSLESFKEKLAGISLSDDPCKQLQEAITHWILGGIITSYQAQKIYTDHSSELTMGDYLILDFLGEGGMGRVLKARHKPSERVVALKLFDKTKDNSGSGLSRFKREVMLAKRMMHPNIIIAYDSGETEEYDYLAIEYVDGPDLSKMVKWEGPVPVNKAIHFMIQAAEALAYAHRQQVIHRDVKPHNMMVDDNDTLKILDLGLGRLSWMQNEPGEGGLTQTGQFLGTVDFLAPEQAVSARTADERSDIYALGATMFYILTGRVMFKGDSIVSKIFAHQNEERPSLLEFNADVPPVLDLLYRRMTARDAKNRIQSMEEVSQCLKDIRDGKDIYIGSVPDSDMFSRSETFKKDAAMGGSMVSASGVSTLSNFPAGVESMSGSSSLSQGSFSGVAQNESMASAGKFIGIGAGALALVLLLYLVYSISRGYIAPQGEVQITGLPEQARLEVFDAHNERVKIDNIKVKENGRTFSLPYGYYTFRASAPCYKNITKEITVNSALVPPIASDMTYSSGIAFNNCIPPDALCEVLSEGKTYRTDFSIDRAGGMVALPPGTYQLWIHAPGWDSLQLVKKIEEGKVVEVGFELQLAQFIKLSIPDNFKPYNNVEVVARVKKGASVRGRSFKKILTPDEFASVEWRSIPLLPDTYRLSINSPGFEPFEEEVTLKNVESSTVEVPIQKTLQASFLEQAIQSGAQFRLRDAKGQLSPLYSSLDNWRGEAGQSIESIDLRNSPSINAALELILESGQTISQINAQHSQSDAKTFELVQRIQTKQPECSIQTLHSNLDWQAASKVLKIGGRVWISDKNPKQEKELELGAIPNEAFQIIRIDLKGKRIKKDDLAELAELSGLKAICLTDIPNLFPVDLAPFAAHPSIDVYNKITFEAQKSAFSEILEITGAQFVNKDVLSSLRPLVVGFPEGIIQVWDLQNLKPLLKKDHVRAYALAPDGQTLAISSDEDNTLRLYNLAAISDKPSNEIKDPGFAASVLTISKDGKLLLCASDSGDFALWDLAAMEQKMKDSIGSKITCLAINEQCTMFIIGGHKNALIYQVNGAGLFGTLNADKEKITNEPTFNNLIFSQDGKCVYSNISGQSLNVWGMEGANSCRNMALLDLYHSAVVKSLTLNRGQNQLMAAGRNAGGFSGLAGFNTRLNNQKKDLGWKGEPVSSLICSPSGNILAAVSGSQIRFLNLQGEEQAVWMISSNAEKWIMYKTNAGVCMGNDLSDLKYRTMPTGSAKPVAESKFDLQDEAAVKSLFGQW